jgi:glyoxylase-like metal-dependent hydrolase (beta-lactamase superfamily II)
MVKQGFARPAGLAAALVVAAALGTVVFGQQNPPAPGRQGGAGAAGQPPAAGRQGGGGQNFDNVKVEVLPVQGNLYMANGGFVNSAFSVGEDGVVVVDTMVEPLADKLIAAIRQVAGTKPIRYIVNTHAHMDHVGGNAKVAAAGESVVGGNFAGQVGQQAANSAFIWAHENTMNRMQNPPQGQPALPFAAMPTDTYFTESKEMYFNGEAVQLLYQPAAHTDGDSIVYFRKSDVIVTGDLFVTTTFPIINLAQGGSLNGTIDALNRIIDITVPKDKQEGGTYVIPGHGRLTDEADVVDYRDMVTIIRDRFQDAIKKGQTLEQVKAARLVRDYEGRYGANTGFWTTDAFIEAAYRSLSQPARTSQNR